jgi:hypothetical protein
MKNKNIVWDIIAAIEDNPCVGLPTSLVRGISVHAAEDLAKLLVQHLPELYLTLHHAAGHQVHPRLRGWSQLPKVDPVHGHPDWGSQPGIALFEAYIGRPGEYWVREKEKPLQERIDSDMGYLERNLLAGIRPEIVRVHADRDYKRLNELCAFGNEQIVLAELYAPPDPSRWASETRIYKVK